MQIVRMFGLNLIFVYLATLYLMPSPFLSTLTFVNGNSVLNVLSIS